MYDYDVIVVGAGNAAFAAAVSAHENGAKKILVLEKAPKDMRGGNTHWSGGFLRLSYDKPRDLEPLLPNIEEEYENFYDGVSPYPKSEFRDDLMRVTNGRTDPVLSKIFIDQSQETVFWMHKSGGVKMAPPINIGGVRQGNMIVWPRGTAIGAEHEGVGLSKSWFATAEKLGIEIRYGAAAVDINIDRRGRAVGVEVRDGKEILTITGKAIVLGCGGFEANVQMRTQHISPLMGQAKVRGTPYNQGDGLRMAMKIGALPWGQWSGCHATPISADWGDFAPREFTDKSNRLSYMYGAMLNRQGKRFVDEGEDEKSYTYAKFGREVLAQPGSKVWQFFDHKVIHLLEPRYSTSKPLTANSLDALVAKTDIEDKAQAIKTLEAFNKGAVKSTDKYDPAHKDGLSSKGLTPEKTNWALQLDTPPYYAYSATCGITFTFGGVRINEEAQVIGTDFRPIPGLYACGEMVGGLFYDNYPSGTGLIAGATFGRIAGRNATAEQG